ncbi:MAG: hypothetical protein AB3N06_06560 [Erythrobacter sp.]
MQGFQSGCLWVAGLVAALVLAYAAYLYSIDILAADACVDAGGSFHYDRGECSFTDNDRGEVPPLWPF